MPNDIHVIRNSLYKKLHRQAKSLKKQENIPHHKALDIVARSVGMNNWAHLKHSADQTTTSEKPYKQGLVVAIDIKEAEEFPPKGNFFVQDNLVFPLIFMDSVDESGKVKPDLKDYIEDLESNYVFYRFEGKLPNDIPEVYELTDKYFYFDPLYIWFKGGFFDTNLVFSSLDMED